MINVNFKTSDTEIIFEYDNQAQKILALIKIEDKVRKIYLPAEIIWDFLRDSLISANLAPFKNRELFRRKYEALVALKSTMDSVKKQLDDSPSFIVNENIDIPEDLTPGSIKLIKKEEE
jgi:hypothetical protein